MSQQEMNAQAGLWTFIFEKLITKRCRSYISPNMISSKSCLKKLTASFCMAVAFMMLIVSAGHFEHV